MINTVFTPSKALDFTQRFTDQTQEITIFDKVPFVEMVQERYRQSLQRDQSRSQEKTS